ncbi:hypothetical protein JHK84_029183 [Glycine max]|nr:hypothetical protein JHK86_029060 [Glycine max]KAG5152711.1 hypothetical protein JHK84_029183 [Glycine max]
MVTPPLCFPVTLSALKGILRSWHHTAIMFHNTRLGIRLHSVLEKLELHSKEKIADAYQFMLLEQASRLQYCAPSELTCLSTCAKENNSGVSQICQEYMSPSGLTSGGNEMHNYIARNDDHTGHRILKDTKTLGSAYDRYLQSAGQLTSFNSGEASAISSVGLGRGVGGLPHHSLTDPAVTGHPGGGHDLSRNGRNVNYASQLPVDAASMPGPETLPLPPDASSTLYVEDIFRPFVGYREVRLVSKESKHRGGDPLILCFVDFANPACAATALSALQVLMMNSRNVFLFSNGYKVDELNPESSHLRLQFSRFPGPRSGPGLRGKR